jgi:hypothetical protein
MKSILWFAVGIAAGFAIAHQVNKTQQGRQFFDELDRKAHDFGEAVSEGYRKREAELRSAIDDAADAITDLS